MSKSRRRSGPRTYLPPRCAVCDERGPEPWPPWGSWWEWTFNHYAWKHPELYVEMTYKKWLQDRERAERYPGLFPDPGPDPRRPTPPDPYMEF